MVKKSNYDLLTAEDGIDTLFRNVGKELPLYAAWYPTRAQASYISRRMPEITHLFHLSTFSG